MPKNNRKNVPNYLKSYIQRQISSNQETKQADLSWDVVAIPAAGSGLGYTMPAVAQGSSQNTRSGNLVYCTGMYGRLVFSAADTTNLVRLIFYIPTDVDDTLSVDIHSLIDQDKFTILYDRVITLNGGGNDTKYIQFKRNFHKGKRKGIAVHFDGTGQTDYSRNIIKMYVVSDSDVASHPTITGSMRTYYKDG